MFRIERIGMKPLTVDLAKPVALSASELQRQRSGTRPEVDDMSNDLAETEPRLSVRACLARVQGRAERAVMVGGTPSAPSPDLGHPPAGVRGVGLGRPHAPAGETAFLE